VPYQVGAPGLLHLTRGTATNAINFLFFYFYPEYLKRLQSSEMLDTKIPPTSCFFGTWFVENIFF
jgi:hypothetical protein